MSAVAEQTRLVEITAAFDQQDGTRNSQTIALCEVTSGRSAGEQIAATLRAAADEFENEEMH